MRKRVSLVLFLFAVSVFGSAAPSEAAAELDARIEESRRVLGEIMSSPGQSIPEELLAKCEAIAIYPAVLNGAFFVGGRFGRGVVLRRNSVTNQWGPVAFSTIGGGSFGLQFGGQAADIVFVIMNQGGLEGFLQNNFKIGATAAVAAGPVGRKTEIGTDLSLSAGILSYARTRGLFAGVAFDGAILTQDNNSNTLYYGNPVTSTDILLLHNVQPLESSLALIADLNEYSGRWDQKGAYLYDRPRSSEEKADYRGVIVDLDARNGRMTLLNDSQPEERAAGEPAVKRVRAASARLSTLETGDLVSVYLDQTGRESRAVRIIKIQ